MDELKVEQMINKHIIVGITIKDHDGTFLEQNKCMVTLLESMK